MIQGDRARSRRSIYVVVNLVVDIVYSLLDPRIRITGVAR